MPVRRLSLMCKFWLPITGLSAFDSISPEDNLNTSRDATSGQLSLDLLDSNLLEVDEARLVHVQNEPGPIVTLK